jgi:hypothetical protein
MHQVVKCGTVSSTVTGTSAPNTSHGLSHINDVYGGSVETEPKPGPGMLPFLDHDNGHRLSLGFLAF